MEDQDGAPGQNENEQLLAEEDNAGEVGEVVGGKAVFGLGGDGFPPKGHDQEDGRRSGTIRSGEQGVEV